MIRRSPALRSVRRVEPPQGFAGTDDPQPRSLPRPRPPHAWPGSPVDAAPARPSQPGESDLGVDQRARVAQDRLARRLAGHGATHADVAAAVLVARGRRLLDQPGLAAALGIAVEHVRSLEAGRRPPSHVPHRLAELDTSVDWSAAGVLRRGDPADPASRHPAAHRR